MVIGLVMWINWIGISFSPSRGTKEMVNILMYYILALVKDRV